MSESVGQWLLSLQVFNKLINSCDENMKELSENCFALAQNKTRSSYPQTQTAQVRTRFSYGSFKTPL